MLKMNNILIVFALISIVFISSVPAEDNGNPPETAEANIVLENSEKPEQAPPQTGDAGKDSGNKPALPAVLPSYITPEQVKDFLAKQQEENFVILNFDNADLADVISTISSITGENFIVSSGLNARITIHSSKKIPESEVLNVFESILEVNGISLVKSGDFYKIVASGAARQKPLEIFKDLSAEAVPYGDRPVTQIIPVRYVPAREVTAVLKPMLSRVGTIIPNPRNNLLIVNDNASSIKRLLEVLEVIDIDIFQDKRMIFFQPQYADVRTLADDLTSILNALNYGKEDVVVVPVERINSLVVFASSPDLLRTVKIWIRKLDEDVMAGQNVFVYHVQNVEAQKIASVLTSMYVTSSSKPVSSPPGKTTAISKQKGAVKTVRSTSLPMSGDSSKIEITTFEPTNSLVILAPPGIYRDIVNTVKKLDIYPKEVLIEVLIAEVTLTDEERFGIQWSVLNEFSIEGDPNFTGITQSRSGDAPAYALPPIIGAGSTAAAITAGGLSYLLYKPDKIAAMIHALAAKGRVKILSSPRLLVRDQEEASIEVGSDIPTATSSSQTAETTSTVNQTIEYKTIGIKLKIKPSINDEKTVVLDIEQEVSDQLPNVTVGQEGFSYPAFSTRKTKTSIVVPDKQMIVIGGIMKEKKDKDYQGIPVLSSIPILGSLFRYTTEQVSKTELIILLTPHVITHKSETEQLTMEFLNKLKEVKKVLEENEGLADLTPPEN